MERVLNINADGLRVGESHQNAKYTDREIDQICAMYVPGVTGYRKLAKIWDTTPGTIRDFIKGNRRAQSVAGHRTVRVPDE